MHIKSYMLWLYIIGIEGYKLYDKRVYICKYMDAIFRVNKNIIFLLGGSKHKR